MDPELLELLRRLSDESQTQPLTDDELTALRTGLTEVIGSVDIARPSPDDVTLLSDAVAYLESVDAELAVREEANETRAAEARDLLERAGITVPAAETETAPETAADETADPVVVEDELEPVAAAGSGRRPLPSIGRLAAHRPNRARPVPTATEGDSGPARAVLTASADLPGESSGTELTIERFAQAAARKMETIRKSGDGRGDGEKITLGTIRVDYPEDRMLTASPVRNRDIVNGVVSPTALAASGGICGPVAVDYSIETIAVADRPVKQALANFGAGRGGLRYILPHTLAAVTTDAPASVWTQATDANPGGSTKPHATFLCQAVQEAYVDAVTSIVQFGNFQARYFAEQVTQYMETVDAVHSRLAEATILGAISNGSTRATADSDEIGAARDFLATLDRSCSAYRYRHRLKNNTPLRVIYPYYLHDMIRTDLARNLPGDSGGQAERLAVADAEIERWLAVRYINASQTLDSVADGTGYTGSAPRQGWGAQGAGQLLPWPAKTVIWIFHEGAWVFLDGGELNLGMVRDSTLNKTNDFQMFTETFEKAIFRGHESIEVMMTIAPTGGSIGTVAPSTETVGS